MIYVSINKDNRRDNGINDTTLIETSDLWLENGDVEIADDDVIILHANDIRENKDSRDKLKKLLNEKKIKIYFFTNDTSRGDNIEDFSGHIVYTWKEIEDSYPQLPPPDKKSKPHLIALSILCQGYLAANEEHLEDKDKIIKLPEGITISEVKKENTRISDWWEPALGDNYNAKDLNKELETVDKNKKKNGIEDLIKIITENNGDGYFVNGKLKDNGKIKEFTGKVSEAYGRITKILGKEE